MTSKHCFFRMMHEDFRHKVWMLALSVLGNMLAIPVVYLISAGYRQEAVSVWNLTSQADEIAEFFGYGVVIYGGIVAVTGALIAGLSGFRYVFHRNMTDTYHSIPVKRSTLFWVNWLNGFFIWFVPFLASIGLTLLLGLGRLGTLKDRLAGLVLDEEGIILASRWTTEGKLAVNAFISMLALTVAFLLVYQVVLLAVMLCGNILNTLVTMGTIGTGVCVVYYLFVAFCTQYFNTFIYVVGHEGVIYASPLVSSIILLYRRAVFFDGGDAFCFWVACIVNLTVIMTLGTLAFLAYLKRPSELAEQGLRMKPVRYLIQVLVTLAAALAGWMLFFVMGEGARLVWGIFGAVLSGTVTFGVLDIVFHMEFKAFFKHRALMGATVAAGIFTGFLFYYDWLGYDSYLPDREEIAEIGVYDDLRSNSYNYGYNIKDEMHPLNQVHIRDSAAAYAFLESVVKRKSEAADLTSQYDRVYLEEVLARVTLSNGKTYYRRYQVSSSNNDPACALFSTPEYLNTNFKIRQEESRQYISISLQKGALQRQLQTDTQEGAELFEAIMEAYNRDMEENPEAFIRGDGRLLGCIKLSDKGYGNRRYLEVFEGMKHTREVLRQQDCGWLADPVSAEDVKEIWLGLGYQYRNIGGSPDLVGTARDVYGVKPEENIKTDSSETSAETSPDLPYEETMPAYVDQEYEEEEKVLCITDEAEIRELLELISYDSGRYYSGGAFRPQLVERVTIVLSEEERELSVNIPVGALPEKYILRFGTLQQ